MIYFDYASTTPLSKEVLKTYTYIMEHYYANSDSMHDIGLKVNELMEQSREQIGSLLQVSSEDIIFTSGASESNNTFIKGVLGDHIYTKYLEAKKREWRAFRAQVTDWEIRQYLYKY